MVTLYFWTLIIFNSGSNLFSLSTRSLSPVYTPHIQVINCVPELCPILHCTYSDWCSLFPVHTPSGLVVPSVVLLPKSNFNSTSSQSYIKISFHFLIKAELGQAATHLVIMLIWMILAFISKKCIQSEWPLHQIHRRYFPLEIVGVYFHTPQSSADSEVAFMNDSSLY